MLSFSLMVAIFRVDHLLTIGESPSCSWVHIRLPCTAARCTWVDHLDDIDIVDVHVLWRHVTVHHVSFWWYKSK